MEEQDNVDDVVEEQKNHADPDTSPVEEYDEVNIYPQERADYIVALSPIRSSHLLHRLLVNKAHAECHRLQYGARANTRAGTFRRVR